MKNSIKKVLKYLTDEKYRFSVNAIHALNKNMPDDEYLKRQFEISTGYPLNLDNPRTFNEKLQWLKLNDRNGIYTKMVDKYEAKQLLSVLIGDKHIIPTIGVWDSCNKIPFQELPERFVLKSTHDSGGVMIIKDKSMLKKGEVEAFFNKRLKTNFYYSYREWPYKNITPRIIAEKYMVDESGFELKDYKLFVFGGTVHYIQVDYDRFVDHHRNFYDREWNYVPFTTLYPTNPERNIRKPDCLSEMIYIAGNNCKVY